MKSSGIFVINKPLGLTSNDVIQKIKNKFSIKKIGHAGTLDPLASGVLVVLVNSATKLSQFLLEKSKSYRVKFKLFEETSTLDKEGDVVVTTEHFKISKTDIMNIVHKYDGYIYEQYPPTFSAIKINGIKLYELARKNKLNNVEIKPKKVTIEKCEFLNFSLKTNEIELLIRCSKGTYVRSFAKDFARELNTVATVTELERIMSGNISIDQAKTIEEIELGDLISSFEIINKMGYPIIGYHFEQEIRNGKNIILPKHTEPIIFLSNNKSELIAAYKWVANSMYAPLRGLWEIDENEPKTMAEMETE